MKAPGQSPPRAAPFFIASPVIQAQSGLHHLDQGVHEEQQGAHPAWSGG